MGKIFKGMTPGLIILLAFLAPINSEACTGGLSLGFPGGGQNMIGATLDWSSVLDLSMMKATLVVSSGGYRYLRIAYGGQPGDGAWINEKGVGYKDFSRLITNGPDVPEIDQNVVSDQLMKGSDSAKKLIQTWTPILEQYGCGQPKDAMNGWAILVVDNDEGYLVEGGDTLENGSVKHLHGVIGPMKDTIFAQANYYLDETLRKYQGSFYPDIGVGGAGYERGRRMWNMLAQQQYNNITKGEGNGLIGVDYWMEVLRSRGTQTIKTNDPWKSLWYQKPLDLASPTQGEDAICKNMGAVGESIGLTYCGQIVRPSNRLPHLLSCIWSGLGFPLTSPYLPFYIGINQVPEELASGDREGSFASVFNTLYNLVFEEKTVKGRRTLVPNTGRLRMMVEVWRSFDAGSLAQSEAIEANVESLAREGKEEEARTILTNFLRDRSSQAVSEAQKWINKWSK